MEREAREVADVVPGRMGFACTGWLRIVLPLFFGLSLLVFPSFGFTFSAEDGNISYIDSQSFTPGSEGLQTSESLQTVIASENGSSAAPAAEAGEAHGESSFDPVTLIFNHISDSHEWHIFSIGDFHLTVPLPVILYSRLRGEWFCFMSSKFEHGHASYKGFRMEPPPNGGRMVIVEDVGPALAATTPLPLDLSFTKNVLGIFVVITIMLVTLIPVARRYARGEGVNTAPCGVQNLVEPIVLFVRDQIAIPNIGRKHAERFVPFLLTLFLFILLNNLFGLIPIFPFGANVTGNITVTMALALFTFFITNFSGNRHYWRDIFNTPGIPTLLKLPVPIIPAVEVFGVITKPIVLMIRLFANMLSGHMIILVFMCLIFLFGSLNAVAGYSISVVSVFFTMFITLLDVLVSFIQAYVFTLLSAIYFGGAVADGSHE